MTALLGKVAFYKLCAAPPHACCKALWPLLCLLFSRHACDAARYILELLPQSYG